MKRFFCLIAVTVIAVPFLVNASEPGTDWKLYGSARMSGAYWDRILFYQDSVANNPSTYKEDQVHLKRMITDLEWMSRFGAEIKKEKYGFRFEAGWGSAMRQYSVDFATLSTAAKYRDAMVLRRLYGEWFINDHFTLLIGQEWCIANFFPSAQIFDMESGLCYSGALFTGRRPQIKISGSIKDLVPLLNAKAELAVVKPDTFIVATWQPEWDVDVEEIIPKIETGATIEYKMGMADVKLQIVAGINRYNLVTNRDSYDKSLTTRNIVAAQCLAGLVDFTVWKARFSFAYAQGKNLASYGVLMGNPWGDRTDPETMTFYPRWGFTKDDTTASNPHLCNPFTKQGCVVLNVKPLDFVAGEVGAGKILNFPEASEYLIVQQGQRTNFNRRWACYANLQFTVLNGHLLVIPEYSFSDLGGGSSSSGMINQGKWHAYGLLVQFDM
jgi:hypothetical protein